MTQPNKSFAASTPDIAGQETRLTGDEPVEAEPPQTTLSLWVDVVLDDDDDDWSAFGDAPSAVRAAASAVAACPSLEIGRAEATVALSTDAEVAALNSQFRGKHQPTNVLSFPAAQLREGLPLMGMPLDEGRRPLGDIILARETILMEAIDLELPPVHHLQHLVVHGLLHLLGYDHIADDQALVMEALETRILSVLGITDPYAEPNAGDA